jgi:hypothetical protein
MAVPLIIPEMGKKYHCYNVTTKTTDTYEYEGPEDQGFDETRCNLDTHRGLRLSENKLNHVLPGNTFIVDTGFYGKVEFQVISLEAFCNLPEPNTEPELETAKDNSHLYSEKK